VPVRIASEKTSKKPERLSSGVSKSAWPSNQTTPRSGREMPPVVPRHVMQLPESVSGKPPASIVSATVSARRASDPSCA
jgi:hypothetical protein